MREIFLTQGKTAIVDDVDYTQLVNFTWHAKVNRQKDGSPSNRWYAYRRILKTEDGFPGAVSMHKIILTVVPPGYEIDHINGNGLDNQRANLRIVSHRVNLQNIHSPKTSAFPGVCWSSRQRKWIAYIYRGNVHHHLGVFTDENEAATAYRVACAVLG